jgi:hypothetical protein
MEVNRQILGATTFVHQACAGFVLVTLTLWLQSAGIGMLLAWIRRVAEGAIHKMSAMRAAALVVRFTTAVVILHELEILLWASFYRWICLPSWVSAFYFFGEQLVDCWYQQCNSASRLAAVWAAGEHDRGVDVRNIREPSLCDNHPAH